MIFVFPPVVAARRVYRLKNTKKAADVYSAVAINQS